MVVDATAWSLAGGRILNHTMGVHDREYHSVAPTSINQQQVKNGTWNVGLSRQGALSLQLRPHVRLSSATVVSFGWK